MIAMFGYQKGRGGTAVLMYLNIRYIHRTLVYGQVPMMEYIVEPGVLSRVNGGSECEFWGYNQLRILRTPASIFILTKQLLRGK